MQQADSRRHAGYCRRKGYPSLLMDAVFPDRVKYRARRASILIICAIACSCMAGCLGRREPRAYAMIDDAFSLIYPEITNILLRDFSTSLTASRIAPPLLSYPPDPVQIDARLSLISDNADSHIIASPAIAGYLARKGESIGTRGISLLGLPQEGLAPGWKVLRWDSRETFRVLGTLAALWFNANLVSKNAEAPAALHVSIVYARGPGRTDDDLNAFVEAFRQSLSSAAPDLDERPSLEDGVISIFDIDAMHLPGDRAAQVQSALLQAQSRNPGLLVLAAGSSRALDAARKWQNTAIIADLRGLGTNIDTRGLFAAIGENPKAIRSTLNAEIQRAREQSFQDDLLVAPALILSRDAQRLLYNRPNMR